MHRMILVCLALLSLAIVAQAIELSDDFSAYQEGSDGSPVWDSTSFAWEVHAGKLLVDGPMGIATMAKQPRFRRITTEATVVLREASAKDWKVAAVALEADSRNLWHMALAEGPDDQGKRLFCELVEMRDGSWLAQHNLEQTVRENFDLQWEYNTPYRLRIAMTPEGIEGQVLDMQGKQLSRIGYAFSAEAVTIGRPALRASGFKGEFDDVKIVASDPAPETPAGEKTFPPYEVAASDLFTSEATGFFRAEQRDGRWWLVDPKGRCFLAIGTDHCRYGGHWCQDLGYAPYGRKNDAKWESRDDWAKQTTGRLKSWGFNLLGAGGGGECHYQGLAHTAFVSFGSVFAGYDDICEKVHWTGFPNVFSPKWPAYCEKTARRACADSRDDPWLFGYFLDNELEWYGKSHTEGGLFDEAMKKPADHTAKRALVEYLKGNYRTIGALNEAWGMDLESFEAISALDSLSGDNAEIVREDKIGFVRLIAEEYFKHTTAAIRKYDPNHLVIGCRFAGNAPAGIWDINGKYCDVVTFNSYDRVDLGKGVAPGVAERFREFYEQAQKPMMITEWSFPALDSGLPCKHGAGMRVDTQEQKAECFRIYQEMIFRLPFMVGSDYFMWVDEPELGIADTFPEDSNYGLVNVDDEPYPELTAMATRVHKTVYDLHAGEYPEVGVREGRVVFNEGKAAVTCTLRTWIDGEQREEEITLGAGEERTIQLDWEPGPGGHLVVIEVDPERKTADGERSNNRLVEAIWKEGIDLPARLRGRKVAALIVSNQSARPVKDAVAVIEGGELPKDVVGPRFEAVVVTDLGGKALASQVDGAELAVGVGDLAPWACRTLLVSWPNFMEGLWPPGGIKSWAEGERAGLDNGRLLLEWDSPWTGNVVDRISVDGELLGSYNPLVWQEVGGQNQWVSASAGRQPAPSPGPVRSVIDMVCRGGEAKPITAVDEEGRQETQRATPVGFEVSHRVVVYPNKSWFLAKLNYVKNTSDRPLTLKGYFFYLNGTIGGSAEGDGEAGPGVPNYYGWAGAAWQDDEAGYVFGAIPLDDKLQAHFWLDEGGGQHPDARRELKPPLTLQPGESFVDGDQPWLLVYGAKAEGRPWKEMREVAEEMEAVRVEVEEL